jgi:hypothetical protein
MTDLRSRNTLARSKIAEFEAFCANKGWVRVIAVGEYEVLRMRHPDWREPMIVHQKNDPDSMHVTTWGNSADMLRRWMRTRRATNMPKETP